MTFHTKFILIAFLLGLPCIFSCNKKQEKQQEANTPITGNLTITADEAFKPLIEAEKETFEALYQNSKITINYQPELVALNNFFNDSTDVILIGRALTDTENQYIKEQQLRINQIQVAKDALALIISESLPINNLTDSLFIKICNGQIKNWNEVNNSLPDKPISIVIDQSKSSNLQFVIRKFNLAPAKINIYTAGSNEEVIKYIQQQPYAIGLISAGWINDEESNEVKAFRKGIKIAKIQKNNRLFSSLQDDLSVKDNPLTREIYLIRKNKKTDLGTGFSSFMVSDKGQRIILKLGLLPARMPGREVIVN